MNESSDLMCWYFQEPDEPDTLIPKSWKVCRQIRLFKSKGNLVFKNSAFLEVSLSVNEIPKIQRNTFPRSNSNSRIKITEKILI